MHMSINKEIGPSAFIISEDQIRERIGALDNMWKAKMNMLKAKEIAFWSEHDRLIDRPVDKTASVEDN